MSESKNEALETLLTLTSPVCIVRVKNGTPADWGAVIVGVAVEFAYGDGTKSSDAQPNAYLRSGQETTLQSQPLCVKNQHVVMRVEVDGNTQLFDRLYPTPSGKCATENVVVLAPKTFVDEADFTKLSGRASRLELLGQ